MAKSDKNKPEENQEPKAEQAAGKDAEVKKKASEAKSKKTSKQESKDAVITPLAVEIEFRGISKLKIAPGIDDNGNLHLSVAFVSVTNQYEIFRLVNLLKQAHGSLYAKIGTNQSAMDFKFDMEAGKVEVLKDEKSLPAGTSKTVEKKDAKKKDNVQEEPAQGKGDIPPAVKIHAVSFNHVPEEKKPFGVAIDYADAQGEIHTVAGRGKNATEAVLEGIGRTKALPADLKEPFEISKALEALDPSPETYKLIRVIQVGSFEEEGGETEGSK